MTDRLSIYLPPFSGDYAGVCSALFELDCLIIIDDAACCTRNYAACDEPRWTGARKAAFSSRLRMLEAVLGDEERLIREAAEAALALRPGFVAILGTPVPALIGRDMTGIAREIERRTGIPALGFHTTGFSYYNKGVSAAFVKLLQRFADPDATPAPGRVNILGLTPLDFSVNGNRGRLAALLEDAGFHVGCSFLMGATLDDVRRSPSAQVNLVVSQSGQAAADYMEKRYRIPYVAAAPMGTKHAQAVLDTLGRAANDKCSRVLTGDKGSCKDAPDTLIVGDQVIANSLRHALQRNGRAAPAAVAGFFGLEPDWALAGDVSLQSERQLIGLLHDGPYRRLIADPLIIGMPQARRLDCFALPHPAVSGHLHRDEMPVFAGADFEDALARWAAP